MSISSVGSIGQSLAALLAQLTGAKQASSTAAASSATDSSSAASMFSSPAPAAAAPGASNSLTGSATASVSDEILALLTQMQQQTGTQAEPATMPASSVSSTSIGATSSASDPLKQLMSAMDSDDDGTVSQTEMENYIQKQGGTAAQGDALFSALNQGGTGNLTQATLASDLQQAQAQPAGGGGHHHHHHMAPSADQAGNDLLGAMDSDSSDSVDQTEFNAFVSGLGGTSSEASSDFAALDPTNTGAVTASQFSSAVSAFEAAGTASATATNAASPILTLLDAFKQTSASTTGTTANVTA
jgi:Ca2+-binding EF-hand superfamily protein